MDAFAVLYGDKAIAKATHNVYAYRISSEADDTMVHSDDGETGAGNRMAQVLDAFDASNVLVVVSRWYGGIHLGASRFRHINNACKEVLEQCGYKRKE
jgi:putative IMPACT (imprinted ancient) family translation regulator